MFIPHFTARLESALYFGTDCYFLLPWLCARTKPLARVFTVKNSQRSWLFACALRLYLVSVEIC